MCAKSVLHPGSCVYKFAMHVIFYITMQKKYISKHECYVCNESALCSILQCKMRVHKYDV